MRDLVVPPLIDLVLCAGAALIVGTSSGKDSDAVLRAIRRERLRRPAWTGPLRAVHTDLGSMDHRSVMDHAQQVCDDLEIPLMVVRRARGDLVVSVSGIRGEENFARAHKDTMSVRNSITSDTFYAADGLRFADALDRLLSRRGSAA